MTVTEEDRQWHAEVSSLDLFAHLTNDELLLWLKGFRNNMEVYVMKAFWVIKNLRKDTRKPGNPETRKPGNLETRKPGNPETRKPGNPA